MVLRDVAEPTGVVFKPQRLSVSGKVIDVDIFAGHVGQ